MCPHKLTLRYESPAEAGGDKPLVQKQNSKRTNCPMSTPVKILAQSADDIPVVSALLQDMTVRIGDIAWLQNEQRFAVIGNRFHWEKKRLFRRPKGERIRSAFHFDGVISVKLYQIDLQDEKTVLNLLDIEVVEHETGNTVTLNFAGGAGVRLEVDAVDMLVTDLGASWQAIERPDHH
ncbi:MAG: hypothetical protein COB37_02760 [Kordiimonadales bacterium]|nr:MAG: hypothetical protein COB37_02760 [Kordiimonadales bacterium]